MHTDDRLRDPILQAVTPDIAGLDAADNPQVLKGVTPQTAGATGTPAAGRSTLDEVREKGVRGALQLLGPGLITGASDDDPSAIGTFSVAGAQFGTGLLWTPIFTAPLTVAVQELCARIALETGVGLGVALRRKFPTWIVGVAVAGLVVANTITIGADLGAVAAAGELLTGGLLKALWLVLPVATLIVVVQMFLTQSAIFKAFKWLTLALFAYVITAILSRPNLVSTAAATFVPHIQFTPAYIALLVALLGTTIQPYLFFWQATAEVEEMRAVGMWTEKEREHVEQRELNAARIDIVIGMVFAQLIMFCIMLTAAVVLHAHGKTSIQSAQDAAGALAPVAGPFAFVIFAAGIIGTGLLAIPVMAASATYAIKEFVGLRGGLDMKPKYRPTFYLVLAVSIFLGAGMNFVHIDPIRALVLASIVNGMLAAPLLALVVLLGSDRQYMRERTSGIVSRVVTWIATALMGTAAVALIVTTFLSRH